MATKHKVIIVGTGPAGLTAAIYLARADMNPLVIEGQEPGGQLTLTTEVENFPGFINGITGPELMDNMRKQAERFGATFKTGWVTNVKTESRPFHLTINGKEEIEAETIIISTGASAKWLNVPGEKENFGKGVSTCATCDGFFYRGKKVVVVGGGDSAMEEASFLTKFADEVTVIHRRSELRASKIMQNRAKENNKIKWALNKMTTEVLSTNGKVSGVKVVDNSTGKEELIETDGFFLAIGHTPNTAFLEDKVELDQNGYVVVEPGTTKTSIPGMFACGDVQDVTYKQAITAAGTGCMAALDVEHYLEGETTLDWSQSLS
ncbi:thioredoxin-disulfide reductase [Saccharibacillus endophyticus]|uniref:Thioredoxin reductase n=1 Tax=Saccharibacillus endophyticus TaxID=2060666 RepID=A0ABQ1ZN87_9BACL|nr:thioredoxin-disulfide reductase [Saccharibacillus endophyticus]GGH70193.1 thioredoxin reductase [Saccharibacillus endophyticus]